MRKQYLTQAMIAKISPEDKGALPEWMVLFSAGWGELADGTRFLVDREAFDLVVAYVSRRGNKVVFDYEHQTLKGVKAPAAGWIEELRWNDAIGIEAKVNWTDAAAEHIAKREYLYFSPVFYVRKSDKRVYGLHSSALTNTPLTNNLVPLLAKLGADCEPNKQEVGTAMDFLKKLAAKLGLAEDSSEEQVIAAVDGLNEKINKKEAKEVIPGDVLDALDLQDGDTSAVVASIHALKQGTKGMVSKADYVALKARLDERDANDAVAGAMKAGKITPDQRDWAVDYAKRDLAGFNTFVAKAPVVVPLDKLPEGHGKVEAKELAGVTAQVASMMGNTADDLKKYGEADAN